jgi:REP element-mobilizing transposase RayT
MAEPVFLLEQSMRPRMEAVIRADCRLRGYELHAVSARSNHIHVVVSTGDVDPDKVMETFKGYCTRELKAAGLKRRHWWTEGGSTRYINDATSLASAVRYVQGQDVSWRKVK